MNSHTTGHNQLIKQYNTVDLVLVITFNITLLILSFAIWKVYWFDSYPPLIVAESRKQKLNNIYQFLSQFSKLVYYLEPEYFLENAGFEAYCYLYLQRETMIFLFCSFVLLEIVEVILYIIYKKVIVNQPQINQCQQYQNIIQLYIISFIFIRFVKKVHSNLNSVFQNLKRSNHLSQRTLQINCSQLECDKYGEQFIKEISEQLQVDESQIVQISDVPDYTQLLEKEQLLESERNWYLIYQNLRNTFIWWTLHKKYQNISQFNISQHKIMTKIQKIIEKDQKTSGIHFICVTNQQEFQNILQKSRSINFRLKRQQLIFENMFKAQEDRKVVISVQEAKEVLDINWFNLSTNIKPHYLQSFLYKVLIYSIVLMISSPNGFIKTLSDANYIQVINKIIKDSIPSPYGKMIISQLHPLLVSLINLVILLLIDILVQSQKWEKYSQYQIRMLEYSYFYLTLNVLIIPIFSQHTETSLYQLFIESQHYQIQFGQFINLVYSQTTIIFYFVFIMQTTVISIFIYLLRVSDLFQSYLSRKMLHYSGKLNNKTFQRVENMFMYGYFYSLQLLILTISLLLAIKYQFILIAALFYLTFRHIMDSYNLLTIYQNQLNSNSKMIMSVLDYHFVAIYILQVFMMLFQFYRVDSNFYLQLIIIVLIVITFLYNLEIKRNGLQQKETSTITNEQIDKWKQMYLHPLIVRGKKQSGDGNQETSMNIEAINLKTW